MKTISPRFGALLRSAAGGVLLLLAAGCSSKGSVTGKVFYQDKPVSGGMVQFSHPQLGIVTSPIATDGSYQFGDLPPAEVKIAVALPAKKQGRPLPKNFDWQKAKAGDPDASDEAIMRKMGLQPAPSSTSADATGSLPKKYSDPQQSGLTYTVTSGSQTHDIKLD